MAVHYPLRIQSPWSESTIPDRSEPSLSIVSKHGPLFTENEDTRGWRSTEIGRFVMKAPRATLPYFNLLSQRILVVCADQRSAELHGIQWHPRDALR